MKYITKVMFFAVILVFLLTKVVFAGDYITEAVQALQRAPVYVFPGTEGTDNDTAGRLQNMLKSKDNIVLVMLPKGAEVGTDTSTIVAGLSEKLGNQRIIGLAVGNKVVGFAPILPSGVAADQMRRADSVSNDPVTALGTFAQNIHIWQSENPKLSPTLKPTVSTSKSSQINSLLLILLLPVSVVVIFVILGFITNRRMASQKCKEKTRFKAPNQVKDLLAKIVRERLQVRDGDLRQVVYQMCLDIERYFKSGSNDKKRDALFFNERLTEVDEVLLKYIDVQENMRYYDEPQKELCRGKESIGDFSQYVLASIRRGNAANLVEYKVNTNILEAQRYK